ncbi:MULTISPECIES: alpha-glucuronidase family glycosyl hydrolase [Asticcacaulis]|uniref:alpha-glucuronidase family glycosyl hydrolase n=1 Tax=Asticcacaulis TaxID=76890 RepID=UPI001AEB86F1|nr:MULTISPECIES: alpha-glucuronidase family glycosyl hydrolase [Asticcacaulis]MBP2159291.1 alpha-glucuronidase [Asticcacaulis solisilvae]MDR6800336.1 alpha-glucuronidase [Asticcacaulis sp. BE141]
MRFRSLAGLCLAVSLVSGAPALAEDGYDLWLRYRPVEADAQARYRPLATAIVGGEGATIDVAEAELQRGLKGLLGADVPVGDGLTDGAIVLGTPAGSATVRDLNLPLAKLGKEGFLIRTATVGGHSVTVIAGNSDVGVLYGAFRYLSLIQTRQDVARLDTADAPKLQVRVLNHWDNLDGHVERGYAGDSIWDWWRLPDLVDPRYADYARANASVGINGAVLNNVNSKAISLTAPYLAKTAAVANVLRPYGMKVYLSARFSAPLELKGCPTADPLDPCVKAWWKTKADEIYATIPDFGGFLVKANSEGQPGPGDYKRSHAEGANMLAEALKAHGGIVMWRAFIYSEHDADDRAKQAYTELQPLDGTFAPNVLLQIKNGAIDFQPREPFHPLFGAMPKTNQMLEVQLTKEYLGQATHLVYSTALYEEVLDADTHQGKGKSKRMTVADVLEATPLTGMAGVANIGDDRDWTGSDFNQADWYGFGRLAWNPDASSRDIAVDWTKMTWTNDPAFVAPVVDMMMASRETVVKYMTPLGLHHQMATGHHYGPGPWVCDLSRPEWNPCYYAKADANGIGFDRTKTGSNAIAQYAPGAAKQWLDPKKIDSKDLLWFHHVPWTWKMPDGRTLWDNLVVTYGTGVKEVGGMRRTWTGLQTHVDPERFRAVSSNLVIQEKEAKWWRDASIAWFRSKSKLPLPAGEAEPEKPLEYYMSLEFPYAPGRG